MARTIASNAAFHGAVVPRSAVRTSPAWQAYQILHVAFTAAPLIAGIDKFFHLLANWDMYLAPQVAGALPIPTHEFMLIVGAIEIVAALIVAIKPRIGAYVVAVWLIGIIVNLLLTGTFYDIALRDFGLMLGAFALGRLAAQYD